MTLNFNISYFSFHPPHFTYQCYYINIAVTGEFSLVQIYLPMNLSLKIHEYYGDFKDMWPNSHGYVGTNERQKQTIRAAIQLGLQRMAQLQLSPTYPLSDLLKCLSSFQSTTILHINSCSIKGNILQKQIILWVYFHMIFLKVKKKTIMLFNKFLMVALDIE